MRWRQAARRTSTRAASRRGRAALTWALTSALWAWGFSACAPEPEEGQAAPVSPGDASAPAGNPLDSGLPPSPAAPPGGSPSDASAGDVRSGVGEPSAPDAGEPDRHDANAPEGQDWRAERCEWAPTAGPTGCTGGAMIALEAQAEHVAFSADEGGDGALLVWSHGAELRTLRLDAAGAARHEPGSLLVEAPIRGLAAASSEQGQYVFYSVGRLDDDAPDDVALRYRRVDADGALGPPTLVTTGFELRPSGLPTEVGPRVHGLMDETIGSQTYRRLAVAILDHDGGVRTVHTVDMADTFDYFDIHASHIRANYPFVSAEEGLVSFYEQSIYDNACGIPPHPLMVIQPHWKMIHTAFWSRVGVWWVRNPAVCEGAGGSFVTFVDTGLYLTEHRELGFSPTDAARIALRQDDAQALFVDEQAGALLTLPVDVAERRFGAPLTTPIEGPPATALHPVPTSTGWLVLRERPAGAQSAALEVVPLCAPPR